VWNYWWTMPLGIVVGLVLIWGVLVAALGLTKPGDHDLKQALRLLPDLMRLVTRPSAGLRRRRDHRRVGHAVRHAQRRPDALDKNWPGTPEGLIAVKRLCRLNDI
jgi:hypothetical protein